MASYVIRALATSKLPACCKRKAPRLHRAIDEQNEELVETLATRGRVRKKDTFHRNALHIACMHQPSLEQVQLLCELYPKAVGEHDKVGRLPLHTACANQAALEVVQYLIEQDPESIYDTTDRGTSVLFCALENKASLDVVEYLVDKDPSMMTLTQYRLGKTPVHAAVSRGQTFDVIQFLIRKRPHAIEEFDAWGKTPFACACADPHVEHDVLDFLIDPLAVETPDRSGMYPLHIACANATSVQTLMTLLEEYPNAIAIKDNNGRLPMHVACTNMHIDVVMLAFLEKAYPSALKTFDKMGALPLHLAIQRKIPTESMLWLMGQCEGAVRSRESATKMYPLHLACRAGADPVIIEKLIQVFPEAIASVDSKSNTLFHSACQYRLLTLDLAEMLLAKCNHDTACKPNDDGSLPLHLACQHRAPWPVLQLLIEHYPDALGTKDKKGNTPLHMAFASQTDIRVLVLLAHENHHALFKRNAKGYTPEDCASELVCKRFRRALYWYNLRKVYCPGCIRTKQ